MAISTMPPLFLLVLMTCVLSAPAQLSITFPGQGPPTRTDSRLSRPLIGNDGRVYTCSDRNFFAFESNGSIAWTLHLNFTCNINKSPVHGGTGKIYMVAEDRVLKLDFVNVGNFPPAAEVFFGPEKGQRGAGEIIGVAVSTMSSTVFINIKNRGLFAYAMHGELLWSVGPVLSQNGYRLGCRKGVTGCFFSSVPVIDQCEASIYIANTEGELYSLSLRSPHFNWVQDLSSFDRTFSITSGNNGLLYVIVPTRTFVLALDVFTGNVLWQRSIGPLSSAECTPVVDSNGWMSIGSLDGFLYSISPTGDLRKFTKASELEHVIQVSPLLDCSGYAAYISQTAMGQKVSQVIKDYTYVSATNPKGVVCTLVVPATGVSHWSEIYPGPFTIMLSQSDLKDFVLDEATLLAFVTASGTGNLLQCRSRYQKLLSSCSQTRPKRPNVYTGSERTIISFLLFESIILLVLAGLVRFCCIFWKKKRLQGQGLGTFLEKRHSLQQKKKEFDRTITELQKKAAEDASGHKVIEELGDLLRERRGIERKLSTTYSLGRDKGTDNAPQSPKSLLPLYDRKTRSFSFQSAKKESVTIFPTLSDTSSSEGGSSSTETEYCSISVEEDSKGKAKEAIGGESSSDDDRFVVRNYKRSPSEPASSSKFFGEQERGGNELQGWVEMVEPRSGDRSNSWLKRRRTLSSTT